MKILHISKFYPPEPGGIETFVHDLAGAQVQQGHQVCVLAHQAGFADKSQSEHVKGVAVHRIRTFGQAAYAPVAPGFPLHLASLLRRFTPDVVHAHLPNTSAFWLLWIKKNCPLVLHWHADVVVSLIDRKMQVLYKFYKPLEFLLLKKADRVIATSWQYLNASRPLARFPEKTAVVPLAIDPGRLRRASGRGSCAKKAESDSRFTVLSVGRFSYYKGFEYLVQAAEKVPEAVFILAGDGPRYPAIQKLVAQKGLEHRVRLPGRVDEDRLQELYAACHVFCLPSVERTEAFGIVLLEAMSFGLPLVTTSIEGSGVKAVNVDGVTGLQVPPADPQALGKALDTLRQNKSARSRMGEQALARFRENYEISRLASNPALYGVPGCCAAAPEGV